MRVVWSIAVLFVFGCCGAAAWRASALVFCIGSMLLAVVGTSRFWMSGDLGAAAVKVAVVLLAAAALLPADVVNRVDDALLHVPVLDCSSYEACRPSIGNRWNVWPGGK